MKHFFLSLTAFLCLGFVQMAQAKGTTGAFGLGIALGYPTGITGKYNLDSDHAVDATIGWSRSDLLIQSTYLFHFHKPVQNLPIDTYLGIGGRLYTFDNHYYKNRVFADHRDETWIGVRAPAGIRYLTQKVPIELFAELALTLYVVPATTTDLDGMLGARWYF